MKKLIIGGKCHNGHHIAEDGIQKDSRGRNRCKLCARASRRRERMSGVPHIEATHCEICGGEPTQAINQHIRGLNADHDHKTRRFRGWLCFWCNQIVARVDADPNLLEKVARYFASQSSQ